MPNRYSVSQYNQISFRKYFKENMEDLGLEPPTGLYDTLGKAITTASLIGSQIKLFGAKATLSELAGATFKLEKLGMAGTTLALLYCGAFIGSIAVAAGRVIGSGTEIADVYYLFHKKDYDFLNYHLFYSQHKEIIDYTMPNRRYYAIKAQKINHR